MVKKTDIKRIAVLTGGGDCPGLNAVIRAVTKTAQNDYGIEVMGILDSYWGLVNDDMHVLTNRDVSGILGVGGTILGTSRVDPFREGYEKGILDSPDEDWDIVKAVMKKREIDALVAIGGDGTLRVANRAAEAGIPVVGVPKTIDNDIADTDVTFGFNSAVSIVMNAIDILHTTAMSHHRVMVVETMGRHAGWLALEAGVAGGGDIILIPEIPYDINEVFERVEERSRIGKRFSIVVVAEGAKPADGGEVYSGEHDQSGREVLGGIGKHVADQIQENTGLSSRLTDLGHLQRGGPPTAFDRLLATQFGHAAINLLANGTYGHTVVFKAGAIQSSPLSQATRKQKTVPSDHPLIKAAVSVGTSFGVEGM